MLNRLLIGIILSLILLLLACKDTDKVTPKFSVANKDILAAIPHVESEIFRADIFKEYLLDAILKNFITLS